MLTVEERKAARDLMERGILSPSIERIREEVAGGIQPPVYKSCNGGACKRLAQA